MGLVEIRKLSQHLCPPLDGHLTSLLLQEFVSLERRYIQRDWEPTELDCGQFCEILGRIIYHADSQNLDRGRDFNDCFRYVIDDQNRHAISPRHNAIHLLTVGRTVYKLRSQRGAVHISATYGPNQMDARLVVECVRWCMNELLRIFWTSDRESVARSIRELLQFDVPSVGVFDGRPLVQRTDLTGDEEVVLLLHYAGEQGLSRREIGEAAPIPASTVSDSLSRLTSARYREVIKRGDGRYQLTELGSKRVRDQLAPKLTID